MASDDVNRAPPRGGGNPSRIRRTSLGVSDHQAVSTCPDAITRAHHRHRRSLPGINRPNSADRRDQNEPAFPLKIAVVMFLGPPLLWRAARRAHLVTMVICADPDRLCHRRFRRHLFPSLTASAVLPLAISRRSSTRPPKDRFRQPIQAQSGAGLTQPNERHFFSSRRRAPSGGSARAPTSKTTTSSWLLPALLVSGADAAVSRNRVLPSIFPFLVIDPRGR